MIHACVRMDILVASRAVNRFNANGSRKIVEKFGTRWQSIINKQSFPTYTPTKMSYLCKYGCRFRYDYRLKTNMSLPLSLPLCHAVIKIWVHSTRISSNWKFILPNNLLILNQELAENLNQSPKSESRLVVTYSKLIKTRRKWNGFIFWYFRALV